jgi:hypothetical protein
MMEVIVNLTQVNRLAAVAAVVTVQRLHELEVLGVVALEDHLLQERLVMPEVSLQ